MSALWAVALIMLLSGTAKLRSGEDVQATFTRLRVPRPFAAPALARAFPWLELLLAAALLQPFTLLRPVVGLVAVALFAAFLALVVRAQDDGVSCGCFGEASAPTSPLHVAVNLIGAALAVAAIAWPPGPITEVLSPQPAFALPFLALVGVATWCWYALLVLLPDLLDGVSALAAAPAEARR